MKIVVDAFGSDKGEIVAAQGSALAVAQDPDLSVVIVGDSDLIHQHLKDCNADLTRIEVVDAKEKISNDDVPTVAIRAKKESSLVRALELTKTREDVAGMVSFGSTGAVLTGAFLKIGRIKGITRPALCPLLPTVTGERVALVDCGANMDCRPEFLEQFALMGSAYMMTRGVENPRVALVCVGDEDKKGNELTHEVFKRLKDSPLNFVGNMEARYALSGDYDVLVCDGFVGNVLLKTTEGTAMMVMKMLKESISSSFKAKMGALMMKKQLKQLKNAMDYQSEGGAVFLGVNKVLVKGHGAANENSVKMTILQAKSLAQNGLIEKIQERLAQWQPMKNEA